MSESDCSEVCRSRIGFKDDAVLVGIGEDRGNDPLAVEIVKRVIHGRRCNTETSGLVAIDLDIDRKSLIGNVAGDIAKLRKLPQFVDQFWRPFRKLRGSASCRMNWYCVLLTVPSIVRS